MEPAHRRQRRAAAGHQTARGYVLRGQPVDVCWSLQYTGYTHFDSEPINDALDDREASFARAQGGIANFRNSESSGPGAAPSVLLTLPYPISANRYWASRTVTPQGRPALTSTYVTPEAKSYKVQVQILALVAGVRKTIAGRARVEFTLYSNRPQDWQKRMRKEGAAWGRHRAVPGSRQRPEGRAGQPEGRRFQDDAWVREISARRAEPDEFGARLVAVVTPQAVEQPQTDLFGAVVQERNA